jgi:hypothetical protein
VDRADRNAATARKASRIARRMASRCANVNDFCSDAILARDRALLEVLPVPSSTYPPKRCPGPRRVCWPRGRTETPPQIIETDSIEPRRPSGESVQAVVTGAGRDFGSAGELWVLEGALEVLASSHITSSTVLGPRLSGIERAPDPSAPTHDGNCGPLLSPWLDVERRRIRSNSRDISRRTTSPHRRMARSGWSLCAFFRRHVTEHRIGFPQRVGSLAQNARLPHSHGRGIAVKRGRTRNVADGRSTIHSVSVVKPVVACFEVSIDGRFSGVHRGAHARHVDPFVTLWRCDFQSRLESIGFSR